MDKYSIKLPAIKSLPSLNEARIQLFEGRNVRGNSQQDYFKQITELCGGKVVDRFFTNDRLDIVFDYGKELDNEIIVLIYL